jgi:RNA polymerase sigma-70 factor, ECF subfamily
MVMKLAMVLNDDVLVRRMLAGDEDAFTLLYRTRHPAIYRFALHMSANPSVAEDVTQEVFMTLIRDPGRFDPARGTLGGYLYGIARNHLRKRWEQDRHSVPLADDAESLGRNQGHVAAPANGNGNGHGAIQDSHDLLTSLETIERVRQAIGTLPENYREVVVLCELEEMSYEEAAAALECPVGTIRSRLHRARTLLLEKLRIPAAKTRTAVGP